MFGDESWVIGNIDSAPSPSIWSRLQDKLFERALVMFPEETPDRWQNIAAQVPGKTAWEVWEHYGALVHDVLEIDSGRVQPPCYPDDSFQTGWDSSTDSPSSRLAFGSKSKHAEAERKKGVPWTEEEHRLFLIGLQKYGKGDWRSISRMAVMSRTPTQVASHAQKYYLRLNSMKKEKKRSSIHDITTVVDDQPNSSSSSVAAALANNTTQPPMVYNNMASSLAPSLNAMKTMASTSSVYQTPFGFSM